jgi:DNA-binding winged helix-turn-helix (wHTH) protein
METLERDVMGYGLLLGELHALTKHCEVYSKEGRLVLEARRQAVQELLAQYPPEVVARYEWTQRLFSNLENLAP